jgi:pimeloyl-ACP methyl ester carboxylesterase
VADDVTVLLDHLQVERCLVAGWSGGGPHALATGALLPSRVLGVLSIASVVPDGLADLELTAGMGEQNVEEFELARQGEEALRPLLEREATGLAHADAAGLIEGLGTLLPSRVLGVLSIASDVPDGLADLELTAGMGEQNVEEFELARHGEEALRPLLEREATGLAHADAAGIIEGLGTLLPDVDRQVLTAEVGEDMAAGFAEALRTGVDGWLDDDLAFARPWGFELDQLSVPVFLWQGSEDLRVPFAHGQWLARNVPGATAHLEQGQGHLSIAVGSLDRMLDELVTTMPRR